MWWAIAFFAAGFCFLAGLGVAACVLSSRVSARLEGDGERAPQASYAPGGRQPEPLESVASPGLTAEQPTR